MKKFLLYFLAFIFICFILPALLTKQDIQVNSNETQNATEEIAYNYQNYGTIKLLHQETGEIEELELDTYLLRCGISRNASKL
jgi:hypothetical protein